MFPLLGSLSGDSAFWLVINPVGKGRVHTVTGPEDHPVAWHVCLPISCQGGLEKPGKEPGTSSPRGLSGMCIGNTKVHKASQWGSAATHSPQGFPLKALWLPAQGEDGCGHANSLDALG